MMTFRSFGIFSAMFGLCGCAPASRNPPAPGNQCWQLSAVNRVRFQARPGQTAAMVGGTIEGSNDSPTNGFTALGTISSAPADGTWTELSLSNTVPYRYIKYYGPSGSYGQVAEIE